MYKISVPIIDNEMTRYGGRDKVLGELRRIGAKRVFIATGFYFTDPEDRRTVMKNLKENADYFRKAGYEIGVWNWTLACRQKVDQYTYVEKTENGKQIVSDRDICPLDPNFVEFAREYLRDFARAGVDMIMFDDDYRYLGMHDFACTCDRHMKLIREELGEEISPAELRSRVLSGGKSKYRNAWMNVNGKAMEDFAIKMREAVDEINPNIRLGICAVMAGWDKDGSSTPRISKLLAGKTKPFIRLIGAPYWAITRKHGNSRLQNVIEHSRMEKSYCDPEIEVFAEGDTFPRPRFNCPASYLELFDMALRADGTLDGILKYSIDFYTSVEYERGYIDRQEKNAPIYEFIEKNFSNKRNTGIAIYEKRAKFRDTVIPERMADNCNIFDQFYSSASKMIADCSIPTVFNQEGVCTAIFGENARGIDRSLLSGGAILDLTAAKILTEAGIDVGLREVGERAIYSYEYFPEYDVQPNYTQFGAFKITPDKSALVISYFVESNPYLFDRRNPTPAAYLYKNKDGEKFLVYSFESCYESEVVNRSYARSRQIRDSVEWLSGKKLPAYVYGNPDLYVLAKASDDEMAIGLFNCSADEVINPTVELDGEYSAVEFINCSGKILGDKVIIETDIPAFSFAGICVKK